MDQPFEPTPRTMPLKALRFVNLFPPGLRSPVTPCPIPSLPAYAKSAHERKDNLLQGVSGVNWGVVFSGIAVFRGGLEFIPDQAPRRSYNFREVFRSFRYCRAGSMRLSRFRRIPIFFPTTESASIFTTPWEARLRRTFSTSRE